MAKAAIYARYSTDMQSERSIEDQVELCRRPAASLRHEVVETYHDRARSGASVIGRDGLSQMMADAKSKSFDVLIVEALDRLSRDQEDLAAIFKRLSFYGIDILTVHEGKADQLQVGLRGLVGALYLQDLAQKVHRGLAGVTRDGRHAGGRAYGYRPVPGKPGILVIDELEAEVVRRIYREYVAGKTPRQITADLNREGIASPRGKKWSASTLNGNASRHHGILVNPLYAGEMAWNRVRMIKDPETGKRVSRPRTKEEWEQVSVPELAILTRSFMPMRRNVGRNALMLFPLAVELRGVFFPV